MIMPDRSTFFDHTVIEEMARRLRGAGLWDNRLGDGLAMLAARVEVLERFGRFDGHAYEDGEKFKKIDRPLKSWTDARKLLTVVCSFRLFTFTEQPASVADCLLLAVLLDRWERAGVPLPSDVRTMMAGAVAVEWEKPYRVVMVDRGSTLGDVPAGKPGKAAEAGPGELFSMVL